MARSDRVTVGGAGQRGDAAADAGGPGAAGVRRVAAALAEPADLAADSPGGAIRAWGRLGYPRRALRLHAAATAITVDHGGIVPNTVEDLLRLPGIGEYTARAVAAFAFGARTPVVDTNVRRVLSRVVRGVDEPREPATAVDRAEMDHAAARRTGQGGTVLGRRDGARAPWSARPAHPPAGRARSPTAAGGGWPARSPVRPGGRSRPGTAPTGRSAAGSWRRCGTAHCRCRRSRSRRTAGRLRPGPPLRHSLLTDGLAVRVQSTHLALPE